MLIGIVGLVLGLLFLGLWLFIYFRTQNGEDVLVVENLLAFSAGRNLALFRLIICKPVGLYKILHSLEDLKCLGNAESTVHGCYYGRSQEWMIMDVIGKWARLEVFSVESQDNDSKATKVIKLIWWLTVSALLSTLEDTGEILGNRSGAGDIISGNVFCLHCHLSAPFPSLYQETVGFGQYVQFLCLL